VKNDLAILAGAAWAQAGRPKASGPIEYQVTLYKPGAALDEDNFVAALKAANDVLFRGRVVPDDSPEWVRMRGRPVQHIGAAHRGNARLIYQIFPASVAALTVAEVKRLRTRMMGWNGNGMPVDLPSTVIKLCDEVLRLSGQPQ
jgi:hypothetical protein